MAEHTRQRQAVITATTSVGSLRSLRRLDAWYYLAPGAAAARRLELAKQAGIETTTIGAGGLGEVWAPPRFKRAYAAPGEKARPYLAPHDIFQYLPEASSQLSAARNKRIERYEVKRGIVLQTCSGRNLGPSVIVDAYLERFVMSHDLVRIKVEDERMRNYLVGFLHSRTGQGLLRRDKSGSVIDHITDSHVSAQEIPMLEDGVVDQVAELVREAFELAEEARLTLGSALEQLERSLPTPRRPAAPKDGWGVPFAAFRGRLDAASHDPWVAAVRNALVEAGGKPVRASAIVLKPAGRYKTYYVNDKHGLPILSGTQVLQYVLVKPQFMAPFAFDDPAVYELREGWSAYMADGRAEKGLGVVAFITSDRDGWLASGHVGRLAPKEGVDPALLWLAARTWQAQVQIKALASGSVVDSTFPADMERVILPPTGGLDGTPIAEAWAKFPQAVALERQATNLIDEALADITGVETEQLVEEEPVAAAAAEEDLAADEDASDA
jgi:hypothetical protein